MLCVLHESIALYAAEVKLDPLLELALKEYAITEDQQSQHDLARSGRNDNRLPAVHLIARTSKKTGNRPDESRSPSAIPLTAVREDNVV